MIFDIKYRIVYVHSDIGLGQSEIRRTYLSIRQWPRSILDSPDYFSPISDWTYVLCFIGEWPEKMSVQCRIQVWTSPISDLTFAQANLRLDVMSIWTLTYTQIVNFFLFFRSVRYSPQCFSWYFPLCFLLVFSYRFSLFV